ncbi:hypothetical protein GP2143_05915 [marine gamma proteobacterium HTCC2143]|jgi:hypothetical protein|uniref:Uncharacterized protein n=1 Tax=marine gamma proteobacterium HTCC2143 TaxID=247633 RepID=A0YBN3_9GAMM|nr:hypothetical protein GP2143_05915 [marine gamma proteobacterium HTCC2143]
MDMNDIAAISYFSAVGIEIMFGQMQFYWESLKLHNQWALRVHQRDQFSSFG